MPNSQYQLSNLDNPKFLNYYKNILPFDQNEWNSFTTIVKDALPATFRLTAHNSIALYIWKKLNELYIHKIDSVGQEQEIFSFIKSLEWYTLSPAFQIIASRQSIRRTPEFKAFHQVLIAETDTGFINRQETVSMIPVQLLDIKPNHIVLDMCASPGSKSCQILDLLDQNQQQGGFLIANDNDSKRCYLLVHQTKRLRKHNLLIVNQDASFFPNIRVGVVTSKSQDCKNIINNPKNEINQQAKEQCKNLNNGFDENSTLKNVECHHIPDSFEHLQYDRILCDVPCTGDGTLRKNPLIWTNWNIGQANSIHNLQYRILKRGLELLKVNGILIYSTCSLNPVENEAVLSAILAETQGCVVIENVSDLVKGLTYAPGMTDWKVMSKDEIFYDSYDTVPSQQHKNIKESLFPPRRNPQILKQLTNCLRIYPHLQDTGGFFVARLRKVAILPWMCGGVGLENSSLTQTHQEKNGDQIIEHPHFPYTQSGNVIENAQQKRLKIVNTSWPISNLGADVVQDFRMGAFISNYFECLNNTSNQTLLGISDGNPLESISSDDTSKGQNVQTLNLNPNKTKRFKPNSKNNQGFRENPFRFLGSDMASDMELWKDINKFFDFTPEFAVQNISYRSEDVKTTKKEKLQQNTEKDNNNHNEETLSSSKNEIENENLQKSPENIGLRTTSTATSCIKHNLYYVHDRIREIILLNRDRLKIISTGQRILAYNRSLKCDHPYRLCQDGIDISSHAIGEPRKIHILFSDFIQLLHNENCQLTLLSSFVCDQVKNKALGSICLILNEASFETTPEENSIIDTNGDNLSYLKSLTQYFSAWLAPTSIRLFLNKLDVKHYMFLYDIPTNDNAHDTNQ